MGNPFEPTGNVYEELISPTEVPSLPDTYTNISFYVEGGIINLLAKIKELAESEDTSSTGENTGNNNYDECRKSLEEIHTLVDIFKEK